MSLFIGILGLIVFGIYGRFIPESDYWIMWKYLYREPNVILEQENKLKEEENNENIDKIKIIKEKVKLIKNKNQNEKLKPGIDKLLNNNKYREKMIGFWLIMSGLMYMYYSTVVVVPEIIFRDDILIETNPIEQIPQLHQIYDFIAIHLNLFENAPRIVTLIILIMTLVAHGILGVFLYKAWKNGLGIREKIIFYLFADSERRIYKWFRNGIVKAFGIFNYKDTNTNKNKHDKDNLIPLDLDLEIIKGIGYLLIIIGIINSILFFIWLKDSTIHKTWLIILTALATLVANAGWAIVPSMLASRFPTHFRVTGSILAYNGVLAISFASPFIIMEVYLSIKSEYIIFIAMVLGAISMIIGANRLIHHKKM